MPRKPPATDLPEPATDPAWADECLAVVRRGQRLMEFRPETRKHKRRGPKVPRHDFALIPQIAEAWRSVCRRPECRRAFGCAFGKRRRDGEIPDPHSVPCWKALPKAVSFALAVAINARVEPYAPEDSFRRKREDEVMRAARGDLADREKAHREAQESAAEAARDGSSCRTAS